MKKFAPVVAALSLSALALAGCGSPGRINGVDVSEDVPFLAVVEQAWRDQVSTEHWITMAPVTHCWLPTDRKTHKIDSQAYCGPIRHLTTGAGHGTFDLVTFRAALGPDKQVFVDPADVTLAQSGLSAPSEKVLYHPSGDEPIDPDEVPEPAAPAAATGAVQWTTAALAEAHEPANGTIIVPGYRVTVHEAGIVSTIPGEGDIPFYVPAAGEEFLGVKLDVQVDPNYPASDSAVVDTSIAYSVRIGSKIVPLTSGGSDSEGGDGSGTESGDGPPAQTLLVSVPAGGDAQLVVGVAGVDQTFSFRTGERTSTTAEGNYQPTSAIGLQKQYATRKFTKGDFSITHGVTFTDAYVSAFDPRIGWAPRGRMFVALRFASGGFDESSWQYQTPTINSEKTLRFDDNRVELLDGSPIEQEAQAGNADGTVLLSIPASLRKFEVTYQPQGTFAVQDVWADGGASPRSGSFKLRPLHFTIQLG